MHSVGQAKADIMFTGDSNLSSSKSDQIMSFCLPAFLIYGNYIYPETAVIWKKTFQFVSRIIFDIFETFSRSEL